jgi:hypothetical protein
MKKFITMMLVLISVIGIAMAQPAMSPRGSENAAICAENLLTCKQQGVRDVLPVEIVSYDGDHFPRPMTELMCPGGLGFKTLEQYEWYMWETTFEVSGAIYDQWLLSTVMVHSGYVKVTVGDAQGNTGTDSIWFPIKESQMLENFIMEVGDDLYPTFSGTALPEHVRLRMYRYNHGTGVGQQQFMLEPGYWEFRDENAYYQDGELWEYMLKLMDTCYSTLEYDILGMLLETSQVGDEWRLMTKTELSQNGGVFGPYEFVYFVYTIDENGVRHHFMQGGQPVKLDQYTSEWTIPGPHVDPYYQCGVARILEDGSFELLSLSNKVPNPLHDTNGLDEPSQVLSMSVYPNPTSGSFKVVGTGSLRVVNALGQCILTQAIDGEKNIELPHGIYFVSIGGSTQKIVVE